MNEIEEGPIGDNDIKQLEQLHNLTKNHFPCDKCDWRKGERVSVAALRMHIQRRHGKLRGQPRFFRRLPQREAQRAYKRNMRLANFKQGLNAKGEPYNPNYTHLARGPRGVKKSGIRYPSDSLEYKRAMYQKVKARNLALGLNARGKPLSTKFSRSRSRSIALSKGMRASWERRKALKAAEAFSSHAPPLQSAPDTHGDAARSILVAASVLRAVMAGNKLPI